MVKKMEVSEIERLISVLSKSDITNFELEGEGWRLSLVRSSEPVAKQPQVQGSYAQPVVVADSPLDAGIKVESPIVGTFYRRPSPESEPFVTEGASVKKGQTLCIVEAMKLMNEIPSPCDGKVRKVLLNDAQVVEFGEVMFVIDPF
jgi:acetyl-CoA carboxylase biotin carboxyl carrier protein